MYSPFFIAAKKWGSHIHTLVYAYPMIQHQLGENGTPVDWQINSSVMYPLPNSGHFYRGGSQQRNQSWKNVGDASSASQNKAKFSFCCRNRDGNSCFS
ncbi:hypothetical protein [Chryseobacterium indoltheticum]|uniref:hypothetical protein n=1 Tax=Chryseobacterium indoltheticum TaxID=254 RepID=UPI003F49914C